MFKRASSFEQFFNATGSEAVRIKTNGTGFVGGAVVLNDDSTAAELELEKRKLQAAMIECDEAIDSIRSQLSRATAIKLKTGQWADPDWWGRTQSALRHRGRQRQNMQTTLAEINRRIKEAREQERDDRHRLTRYLEAAAIERIGLEEWNRIVDRAKALKRARL
jgi:hypothetical protein